MSAYVTAVTLQRFGGIMGALAVGLGAYGTHGLPSRLKSLGLSEADILVRLGSHRLLHAYDITTR